MSSRRQKIPTPEELGQEVLIPRADLTEGMQEALLGPMPSAVAAHTSDPDKAERAQELQGVGVELAERISGEIEPEFGKPTPDEVKKGQRGQDIKDRAQGKHSSRNPKKPTGRQATLADVANVKAEFNAAQRELDRNERPYDRDREELLDELDQGII